MAVGTLTFRYTEMLLLSSLVCILCFRICKYVKGLIGLVLMFFCYLSVIPLKLMLFSYIDPYDISRFIGFSVAISSMYLLCSISINSLKHNKVLNVLIIAFLLLPIFLTWSYYFVSGAWISADTVVALLQTNFREIIEFLMDSVNSYSIIGLFVFIAIVLLLSYLFSTKCLENKIRRKSLILFLLPWVFLTYKCSDNLLTNIIVDTRNYIKSYDAFVSAQEERKHNIDSNIKNMKGLSMGNKGIYVVVIGESQLKDNMSAYGYNKTTTPWLDEFKKEKNVVFFTNAYSCHAYTTVSLAYALTAKNQYNELDAKDAVSLIEVANALNFDTVWISNQTRYSLADNPITVIASSAKQQIWNNNSAETCYTVYHDEIILDSIDKLSLSDNMLIFVHMMGNHFVYSERYPKKFNIFGDTRLVDRYDNSIVYNDYVMENLVSRVSKLPNFKALMYFSDHGEDIKNQTRHDVNKFTFDMTRVPMYVYFSDEFIEANPEIYDNMNHNKDNVFTNDLVFDVIMGMMGTRIPNIYDEANDLTSKYYNKDVRRFKTLYGKRFITEDEKLSI